MTSQPKQPQALNLALVGTAIVALATGPFFRLITEVLMSLLRGSTFGTGQTKGQESFLLLLVESSLYGLIVSAPTASVNAAAIGLLARRRCDSAVWSALSGAVLGLAFGIHASWISTGGLVFEFGWVDIQYMLTLSAVYVVAILTLALCYWWIAIRPLRHWRLRMQSGADAIRAME